MEGIWNRGLPGMKKLLPVILILIVILLPHLLYSYRQYNVLLITIDTLRADHLSCYNPQASKTPNIDEMARAGTLFSNAYSLIPITLPAHTSIFTSRSPYESSVFNNGDMVGDKAPVLAVDLADAGYHTAAFVSLAVLKKGFGLNRGFDLYEDDLGEARWYRLAHEMNSVVLPWLEQQQDKRFFAWVHYSDPHEPYIPVDAQSDTEVFVNGRHHARYCVAKKEKIHVVFPASPGENTIEFRAIGSNAHVINSVSIRKEQGLELFYDRGWSERTLQNGVREKYFSNSFFIKVINKNEMPSSVNLHFRGDIDQDLETVRRNYAVEVQYMDKYVGQLMGKLRQLGLLDKTIVILTGDHGEGLGTHTRIGHLFPLYSEVTHVPLIVRYPRLGWGGRRVGSLVSHLDIKPTILDLLHLKSQDGMRGESLKQYLTWSPVDWLLAKHRDRSNVFLSTFVPQGRSNSFALIHNHLKLIQTRKDRDWKWEAYDLSDDPMEKRNLALLDPERFKSVQFSSLRTILETYSRDAERAKEGHKNPDLTQEQKEMMRDLGYVTP
jgi:arylsulfatase A-like enzyme